jgi:hypothetical protein
LGQPRRRGAIFRWRGDLGALRGARESRHGVHAGRLRPAGDLERVLYRFKTMAALGIRPFPMVYGDRHRKLPLGSASQRLAHRTLGDFQRWAVRRAYVVAPFEDYDVNAKGAASSS